MPDHISRMFEPTGFPDSERLQFDRCCRFLVCATERPGSAFVKFGLLGRLQRLGNQARRTKDDVEAEVEDRYTSYLGLMRRDPVAFWEVTDRLATAYGEAVLRRWHVLKDYV